MSEQKQALQDKLDQLQDSMSTLRDTIVTETEDVGPVAPLPEPPSLPEEHELDQYESLFVDAIMWREDAALSKMKLAKNEMEMCKLMRQNLVGRIAGRLGIDANKHSVTVSQDSKKVVLAKKK